jgi:glucosamine--fructose-6-phosphate aminotransferase (isomerizing)
MCGIVGYLGERDASTVLLQGLRRLEYRGYDSAGIAVLSNGNIDVRRCVGKLANLERLLIRSPVEGTTGIGHTRWATHGRPSDVNAHPHRAGRVVLIHNGIIENYLTLRAELEAKGRRLVSETDTEIVSHLIDDLMEDGHSFESATRRAVQKLEGSFAIVVMCDAEPNRLLAAKSATPIVIGLGEGEQIIASDIPAILELTRDVLFLEDGELATVTREGVSVTRFDGATVDRKPKRILWDPVFRLQMGKMTMHIDRIYK